MAGKIYQFETATWRSPIDRGDVQDLFKDLHRDGRLHLYDERGEGRPDERGSGGGSPDSASTGGGAGEGEEAVGAEGEAGDEHPDGDTVDLPSDTRSGSSFVFRVEPDRPRLDGYVPVVDVATGEVVAGARYDRETGTVEFTEPETTVVTEDRTPSRVDLTPPDGLESGTGGSPSQGASGYVAAKAYKFTRTIRNWQETGCVPTVFRNGGFAFVVGIKVGAPLKLGNGYRITAAEAQRDAAFAAQQAATAIANMLNMGSRVGQVESTFKNYVKQILGALRVPDGRPKGYTVDNCTGFLP
ncbi:hypothetical protein [Streptomyces sp. NPDC008092]|uniref:hypothetical protein n=1 Tax=Streptomyces sp. NPDC008092 TaxID=3364808 RepID=UPI0036E7E76B